MPFFKNLCSLLARGGDKNSAVEGACFRRGEDERRAFMDGCEFSSFEEVLVYGFCAGKIREKEKLKKEIDFLLPHFDNWAHVDCVTASLSAIKRDRDFFSARTAVLRAPRESFTSVFLP